MKWLYIPRKRREQHKVARAAINQFRLCLADIRAHYKHEGLYSTAHLFPPNVWKAAFAQFVLEGRR